jgi:hypothetical protein
MWFDPLTGAADGAARFGKYAICPNTVFHEYVHGIAAKRWRSPDDPDHLLSDTIEEGFADVVAELRQAERAMVDPTEPEDWVATGNRDAACRERVRSLIDPHSTCHSFGATPGYGLYPDNWSGLADWVMAVPVTIPPPPPPDYLPPLWRSPDPHYGATVVGKLAYLMSRPVGSSEWSSGIQVAGIGLDLARDVWMDLLTRRLWDPEFGVGFEPLGYHLIAAAHEIRRDREVPAAVFDAISAAGIWTLEAPVSPPALASPPDYDAGQMRSSPAIVRVDRPEGSRWLVAYVGDHGGAPTADEDEGNLVYRVRNCPPTDWTCDWGPPLTVATVSSAPAGVAHNGLAWLFFRLGNEPFYVAIDPWDLIRGVPTRVPMRDPNSPGCTGRLLLADRPSAAVVGDRVISFWRSKLGGPVPGSELPDYVYFDIVARSAQHVVGFELVFDPPGEFFECPTVVGRTYSTFTATGPADDKIWVFATRVLPRGAVDLHDPRPPGVPNVPVLVYLPWDPATGTVGLRRLAGVDLAGEPVGCPRGHGFFVKGVQVGDERGPDDPPSPFQRISATVHRDGIHVAVSMYERECAPLARMCAGRRLVHLRCDLPCTNSSHWTYPVSLVDRGAFDVVYPAVTIWADVDRWTSDVGIPIVFEEPVLHLFSRGLLRTPSPSYDDWRPAGSRWRRSR